MMCKHGVRWSNGKCALCGEDVGSLFDDKTQQETRIKSIEIAAKEVILQAKNQFVQDKLRGSKLQGAIDSMECAVSGKSR